MSLVISHLRECDHHDNELHFNDIFHVNLANWFFLGFRLPLLLEEICLQCSDAVGWAAVRASGL